MKKIILIIFLTIAGTISAMILTVYCLVQNSYSASYFQYYIDESYIPLDEEITSIKQGLKYAKERAEKWHSEAVLCKASVSFSRVKEIENRTGRISYWFCVSNLGFFKDKMAYSIVEIDMKENAIVEFTSLGGGDTLKWIGIDINKGNIDIEECFNKIQSSFDFEEYKKYSSPFIIIKAGEEEWNFSMLDSLNKQNEGLFVKLDSSNGEILSYRRKR